MERKKVKFLQEIEASVQAEWNSLGIGQADAPQSAVIVSTSKKTGQQSTRKKSSVDDKKKFFTCFPYPYMNGRLHLGHTFSLSKCEFTIRYKKLKGFHCLFPFGFHCTGMPIRACADKLQEEMKKFGVPPVFPEETNDMEPIESKTDALSLDKSKSKKSKVAAKTGNIKYQWNIMKSIGLSDEEIPAFADPMAWLTYFPPKAVEDLQRMGLYVDWRRSFITTDANPYYDSFVRWQFSILKERGRIQFGKRYCIYSPVDGQPCMDHDRASGEGVATQEYTLIKMELQRPFPKALDPFVNKRIFFVCATLRPETMYGQTNCWVHPDINYVVVPTVKDGVFIASAQSIRNMMYQYIVDMDKVSLDSAFRIKGSELLGCALKAPLTKYEIIYALPMLSISEFKGTAIVSSVPSDSPDDFAALTDLKNKKPLRDKYGITDDMVLPFEIVPVLTIPGYGEKAAEVVCGQLKIQSQNDTEKLKEAKELVYLKGFYEGVMVAGPYAGRKVQEIKKFVQRDLLVSLEGVLYMEPEKEVISRSGDKCVVALCDQWYLDYGNREWKSSAKNALLKMELYHDEVRKNFEATLDWIQEHACSRKYGLGTRLPWDPSWLIESLSDSTIYMAFYTIKHILQGEGILQTSGGPVRPEDLTTEVWNHIFFQDAPKPKKTQIPDSILKRARDEFNFWYPVNLRTSGKDLVPNHLTYFIYNHIAIWPDDEKKWPKGVRANGHLLLNSEKMSKSTGNFMTLTEALATFGADAMRFCLADAGDSIEDANFVVAVADNAILRLHAFIMWCKEFFDNASTYRDKSENTEEFEFQDSFMTNAVNNLVHQSDKYYEQNLFKEALRTSFFEMQSARDKYRELVGGELKMRRDIMKRFIELQTILISPICPHLAEYIWQNICHKNGTITNATWPQTAAPDEIILKAGEYIFDCAHSFRVRLISTTGGGKKKPGTTKTVSQKPTHGVIWVAKDYPSWQAMVMTHLSTEYEGDRVPDNKALAAGFGKMPELKKYQKKLMPFVQMVKERVVSIGVERGLRQTSEFDEIEVLRKNLAYLTNSLELDNLIIRSTDESEDDKLKEECCPGSPFIAYSVQDYMTVSVKNAQRSCGYFSSNVRVMEGDTVENVQSRMKRDGIVKDIKKLELFCYTDPQLGPRMLPPEDIFKSDLLTKLNGTGVFHVDSEKQIISFEDGNITVGNQLIYYVDLS